MRPTNEDLAGLMPDARREHDVAPPLDESPGPMAADAVDALKTLLLLVAAPAVKWHEVRALALQALYLCALIAWEAGRRMARTATTPRDVARAVILDHLRRFVGTGGGIAWKDVLDVAGAPADAMREAMRELVAEGLVTQSDDPITMYAPTRKAWDDAPVRMFVNDGKGGLRPLGAPTAAETPAAKGWDVEALLTEAERWRDGFDWQSDQSVAAGRCRQIMYLLGYVATALRAERERADRLDESRKRECREGDKWYLQTKTARSLLSDLLDHVWPAGTMMPPVGRAARAFLAGEEQAPRHDDKREAVLRETECVLRCEARESRVPVDKDLHPADIARELGQQLRSLRHDLSTSRAQLATEDEAHAHTRAQLADAKGGLAAAGREVERLQGVTREALAAQNRAESERDAVRAEHAALVAGITRLMAQLPKGKA